MIYGDLEFDRESQSKNADTSGEAIPDVKVSTGNRPEAGDDGWRPVSSLTEADWEEWMDHQRKTYGEEYAKKHEASLRENFEYLRDF
jgi:hypothetical protein